MRLALTRKTAYFYSLTMLITSGLLFNHLLHLRAAHAQSPTGNGVCHDPWLNDLIPARKKALNVANIDGFGFNIDGIDVQGECNPKLYHNGSWKNQNELTFAIDNYLVNLRKVGACSNNDITLAYRQVWGVSPHGFGESQDCNSYLYNGGIWNTYPQLVDYVKESRNGFDAARIAWSTAGVVFANNPGTVIQPLVVAVAGQGNNIYLINGTNIMKDATGHIILNGGGNIVAQGGGNIVAQGGGNIVAQGGGNITAQGIGNILALAKSNIVAQGGGNYHTLSLGTKPAKLVKVGNISIIMPAGK